MVMELDHGQVLLGEGDLWLGKNQRTTALSAGTGGTTQTVDVGFFIRGHADLEDGGHSGKVEAAGHDIGRNENGARGLAVLVCILGALALRHAGVDLEDGRQVGESSQHVSVEISLCCRWGEHNGFELILPNIVHLVAQGTENGRGEARESRDVDKTLWDVLVGLRGAFGNGADELVAIGAHQPGKLLDARVDGSREQHALAVRSNLLGQVADNLLDVREKAHVHQSISLVEHEGLDTLQLMTERAILLAEEVEQAARGGDKDVAFVEDTVQTRLRIGAANGRLDLEVREALEQGLCLISDLCGQLAGGADDEEGDGTMARGAPRGGGR